MFTKKALHVYSVIIGLLFIVSGVGKLLNTTAFSYLIQQFGFGYLMFLSPLIVLVEILLGLLLLLLISPKRYSLYSLILLIIFSIAFAYAHFKHGVNDCGCLGTIQPSHMPPIISFIRNLILILMSLLVWIKYPKDNVEVAKWKWYFIMAAISISIFIAGFTFRLPPSIVKVPEKPKFENQNVANTELTNFLKPVGDSSYLVFCFSYSCSHCWNSIENLRLFIKMHIADTVIVYALGNANEKEFFYLNFKPDFKINDLPHDKMRKLTNIYPTAFYIKHDTVKYVLQGLLPSPITFQKMYLESGSH